METGHALAPIEEVGANLVERFLSIRRSENTRRAYRRDLADFFGGEPAPADLAVFFGLPYPRAVGAVLDYKARLLAQHLAPSTINRRMAALRALVDLAHTLGACPWQLDSQATAGETVQAYRDTTGITVDQVRLLLAVPNRSTRKGRRDYALLVLLWENALRRAEVATLNVGDFEGTGSRIWVKGKGKAQKEIIHLSARAIMAISDYLAERGELTPADPLFTNEDRAGKGTGRLTPAGLYSIIAALAEKAGIKKRVSPHRIRHTSITAALDATGGDVRAVRKLSRHAKIETLMVYDDNRQEKQRELSELLSRIS